MLEVLKCEDFEITKKLFLNNGLDFSGDGLAVRAMFGKECLGYALFKIEDTAAFIFTIQPVDDIMLADGLLRTALHIGNERGITEAFYTDESLVPLLEKLDFIENMAEKRLKLQNLFTDCCGCLKK